MVNEELVKDETTLIELKKQDLIQGDIFSDGRSFATYRSRSYGQLKKSMNPIAGGKVDLTLTGKTADSYYLLKPRGGRYRFGNSNMSVFRELKSMYNNSLDGLNQNVFNKYLNDITAPRLYRRIKVTAKIG
jgi:hypothetical protein